MNPLKTVVSVTAALSMSCTQATDGEENQPRAFAGECAQTTLSSDEFEDGSADGAALLHELIECAESRQVRLPADRHYSVRSALRIPAGYDVDFNGSTVSVDRSDRSAAFQVLIKPGAVIRNLTLEVPAGITVNRGINLNRDTGMYEVAIVAADQQRNTGSQEHAAVNINGDGTRIEGLRISNFDAGIRCEGGSSNGNWSGIAVDSYVQAFDIHDCRDFSLTDFVARTRSPNAGTNPGHNGLALRGAQNATLSAIDIRDSGEHGIYVAGSPLANRHLNFSDVRVVRPGQCGLKIRNIAVRASDIRIGGLAVTDAHFGNKAGWNEDGLRIEKADNVTVTGFSVRGTDERRSSAHDGIYISDSTNVTIVAPVIVDVENTAIRIRDGGEKQSLHDIVIESPRIEGTREGHGIQIEMQDAESDLRGIAITNAVIYDTAGYAVEVDAPDAVFRDAVTISGEFGGTGAGGYREVRKNASELLEVRIEQSGPSEGALAD